MARALASPSSLFLLFILVASLPLVSSIENLYDKCPDAVTVDDTCHYAFDSDWTNKKGGEGSPFGASCTNWETCEETSRKNFFGFEDQHDYWVACLQCPKNWRPAKMNSGSQVKNKCVSLSFPTQCYQYSKPTSWEQCPTSQFRTNKCNYLTGNDWVTVEQGVDSPLKNFCAQYALCESNLLDDPWTEATSKPVDSYFLMCTQCVGSMTPVLNTVARGTCAAGSYPVSCSGPTPGPTGAPTMAPENHPPGVLDSLKKYAIYIAVGAVVLLLTFLVVNKIRRERKKRLKLAEEVKRQRRKDKRGDGKDLENGQEESFIELGSMPEQMARQLSRQESGANDAEKEARRAKKREKDAALKDALNEGLPEFWRAFTDKATGGVYYYNSDTQETTWTRPLVVVNEGGHVDAEQEKLRAEELAAANEQMKEQMKLLIEANRAMKKEIVRKEKEEKEQPGLAIEKRKGVFGKVTESFNDTLEAAREGRVASIFTPSARKESRTPSNTPFIAVPKAPGSPPPGPMRGGNKKLPSVGEGDASAVDEVAEEQLKAENSAIKSQIKALIDENRQMKKDISRDGN